MVLQRSLDGNSFFVLENGIQTEISEETFKTYFSFVRRERYQRERDIRHGVIGLESRGSRGQFAPIEIISAPCPKSNDEEMHCDECLDALYYAMQILRAEERQLLRSHYWEGKPLSIIAYETNASVRTLTYRRSRALEKLRGWKPLCETYEATISGNGFTRFAANGTLRR